MPRKSFDYLEILKELEVFVENNHLSLLNDIQFGDERVAPKFYVAVSVADLKSLELRVHQFSTMMTHLKKLRCPFLKVKLRPVRVKVRWFFNVIFCHGFIDLMSCSDFFVTQFLR
jgi:hypothetical protein